ncbi:MAG: SPFH domain-containing protein [Clostridia bacterium]|nr:SPFH domain-containing protein [Clostridia bacterium]
MAIFETIKFEGPQDALVWKKTGKEYYLAGDEGVNSGSQLIVDEFYEAILFANGNALDLFKPGRHTLTTQNIPFLKAQYESLTDKTPFPCKVYFINKVHQLELQWGTRGGITVDDPVYNIFLHVGCCGTMAVRISDSRKFLLKFVGNKDTFTNEDLVGNLKGIISSRVKDYISKMMIQGSVSFFVMNSKIYDIGELVMQQLQPIFDSYGLEIVLFNIETIDVPREDYEELQAAKQRSAGRIAEGSTWDKERMYEVLKAAAQNEGSSGNMMGAGMGMGMGAGIGVTMGQAMGNVSGTAFGGMTGAATGQNTAQAPQARTANADYSGMNVNVGGFFGGQAQGQAFCPNCGQPVSAEDKFCSHCGTKLDAKTFCPSCGMETPSGAAFCSQCGTKLK